MNFLIFLSSRALLSYKPLSHKEDVQSNKWNHNSRENSNNNNNNNNNKINNNNNNKSNNDNNNNNKSNVYTG